MTRLHRKKGTLLIIFVAKLLLSVLRNVCRKTFTKKKQLLKNDDDGSKI